MMKPCSLALPGDEWDEGDEPMESMSWNELMAFIREEIGIYLHPDNEGNYVLCIGFSDYGSDSIDEPLAELLIDYVNDSINGMVPPSRHSREEYIEFGMEPDEDLLAMNDDEWESYRRVKFEELRQYEVDHHLNRLYEVMRAVIGRILVVRDMTLEDVDTYWRSTRRKPPTP